MKPDHARRRAAAALLGAGLALAGCGSRRPAPDFAYTLLDGSRHNSAALRGQVLLVNFWATSCAVCVQEMPQIAATHRKYRERGFHTLAVAMRHDAPASVAQFAESRRLPFGVVIDNTGAIAQAFGEITATPTTFLIDRRGRISERWVGEPDFARLQRRVEALLAEG